MLIKAFSRLKHEKIRLIIAGEFYDNQDYYLDLIQSLGLDDSIILKNEFIPDNMVVNYFVHVILLRNHIKCNSKCYTNRLPL